ncbi:MAG: outer membrane protein assembly factor BamA [Candidatus Omnitrophota bacterium]
MKICRNLLFCLAVLSAADFLYAQEPGQSPISKESPKLVKAIEVKGNRTIATAVILSKIKTKIGQEYLQNVISEDIKRLYSTGYFSDVNIDREDYQAGFKVIFVLTEKPIIEKISFSKTRFIRERKLRTVIASKDGAFLDEKVIKDDLRSIAELYRKEGFSLASVDYATEIDAAGAKAKLNFIIEEGRRTRITKIFIKGNSSFKSGRILKLIKTRPRSLFNAGFYKREILDEDMERIVAFYNGEGFLDAKADYEIDESKKNRLYVRINIAEGKRYYVGKVTVSGNTVFSENEIKAQIKETKPAKIFARARLDADADSIRALYFDKGYIFADIKSDTLLDPESGKVDVTLIVDEGVVAYVNKIKVRGNVKTKDIVIRRELRIRPGDRFDGSKLRRSQERLRNLGFFEEISYDVEMPERPSEDKRDLVVEVKESKTGEFSFGGGYSTVDQLVGFIQLEQKNFDWKNFPTFTGAGQDIKLHYEAGTLKQNAYLSFTEPWLFDYPVSFGFDAFRTEHKRAEDVGYGYDDKRVGGDLRLGKEFSDYLKGNAIYSLEDITISNIDDAASSELKKEAGTNTVSRLGLGLTYDTRDNILDPTRGYMLNAFLEGAGGPLSGDKNFTRYTFKGSLDIPLAFKSVLEFRGQAGFADAFGDSDEVPIYERYFAGGAYTIRGYNERNVGPVDPASNDPIGGNSMLVGNIELTVPLMDFIRAAGFFDTGNVWEKAKDFGSGGFKSGLGFGFRVKTPIGPIRLDYGFPLNEEPGEDKKKGKFYFSMSQNF